MRYKTPNLKANQPSILITGSNGFLGKNLLQGIEHHENFPLRVVMWNRLTMGSLSGKQNRQKQLKAIKPKIVVHLAWSATNRTEYQQDQDNFEWSAISSEFARECIDKGAHFVTIGTALEKEDLLLSETNPYLKSKLCLLENLEEYIPRKLVTWIRPGYIFSLEHQRPHIVREYCQLSQNRTSRNEWIRNPNKIQEFIHLNDVSKAIMMLILAERGGIQEIGGGIKTSVSQFINLVSLQLNQELMFSKLVEEWNYEKPNVELANLGWQATSTSNFVNQSQQIYNQLVQKSLNSRFFGLD